MNLYKTALLFASAFATDAGYTDAQAQIHLRLSQLAYCNWKTYDLIAYTGPAEGFVWTWTIYSGALADT